MQFRIFCIYQTESLTVIIYNLNGKLFFFFEISILGVQGARIFLNVHHYILGENNKWEVKKLI